MSNDPKDATVDLSKMTTTHLSKMTTQSIPISTRPSMVSICSEGANLLGVETSTQRRMVGHEIFSRDGAEIKNP